MTPRGLPFLLLALLTGPATGAAAPASPPVKAEQGARIPVEAFADLPFIADPVLSPDGRKIAVRVSANGVEQLAIYTLPVDGSTQPKIVPAGVQARWFRWAGSDRLLIGYTTITIVGGAGFFAIVPATRLKRYELSSNSTIDLAGKAKGLVGDDVIYSDPAGRHILLSAQATVSDTPSVHRVDLATGASVEVQRETKDIWSWFADAEGIVRGGISYSGKAYSIYYRDDAGGPLKKTAAGKLPADESAVDSIHLLQARRSGVIVTNARTGRFAAYNFQLGAADIGSPIFEHPEVDVSGVVIAADGSRIDAVRYEDERPRIKWLVPELEQLQAKIDKTFPGKVNSIINRSDDGNTVLIWSGSAEDPGSYYVFDRKAKRMSLFASPYDALVGKSFSPVKAVRYAARDGLTIPAYLTLPADRPAKNLPLIVMPHGGPFMRDGYSFDPWVQFLANRGYAVLQPNFRGSTGYGRAFVERGYGQWGAAMQDDLDDGRAWLAEQGIVDPKRVCMMGASYGGYAALWAAVRNPSLYRCAISVAGVTDVRAMLKYDGKVLIAPRYSKLWRQKVQGEEKRDLASISPLQQARRFAIPVLVAHGEQDSNVPVDHAKKLIAALTKHKAAVEGVIYPKAGHTFERSEDARDFLKRTEAFLAKHNPPD